MAGKIWLAVARIADIGTPALAQARRRLSSVDRRRAARLVSAQRRREFVAARWLLDLSRQVFGAGPRISASLSHAGGWVACALANGAAPGVDIEPMRPRDFLALGDWAFGDGSRRWLAAEADPRSEFYRRWTQYEAKFKAGAPIGSSEGPRFLVRTWLGHGVAVSLCVPANLWWRTPAAPVRWRRRKGFIVWRTRLDPLEALRSE